MPPSTTPITMFQRGGYVQQRLTNLYSDTKRSYESANVTTPPPNVREEQIEVKDLRRNLQIQQDRLLAWGLDWTDTNAAEARSHGHGEVEIDKQIDQAGLGDEVANVMSEIQRLLEENSKLQHPEKSIKRQSSGGRLGSVPSSTKVWTLLEIVTGRTLLEQLTGCIDVLYRLSESRRAGHSPNWGKKDYKEEAPPPPPPKSLSEDKKTVIDDQSTSLQLKRIYTTLSAHPLFIRFNNLTLHVSPLQASSSLPSYDQANLLQRETVLGLLASYVKVIVDFIPLHHLGDDHGSLRIETMTAFKNILQKMTGSSPMSHQGQLALMGFVIDDSRAKLGFVYELPVDYTQEPNELAFAQPETLNSIIAASYGNSRLPSPPLEDKFRLAYNVVISVLQYMTHGIYHRHINSGNLLFLDRSRSSENDQRPDIRTPHLLLSPQRFMAVPEESLSTSIYRHPVDEICGTDLEIIPSLEIYSLGLVLLEIGMFMPLAKIWKSKYDRTDFMVKIKTHYVKNLASKCGKRYMNMVQRCLDAPENLSSSLSAMNDATEFLFTIAEDLSKCCALDTLGPPALDADLRYLKRLQRKADPQSSVNSLNGWNPVASVKPLTWSELPLPNSNKQPYGSDVKKTEIPKGLEAAKTKPEPAVLKKWPQLDIPQKDLDKWNTILMPRLSILLQNALAGSPESSSVSLMMIGPTPDKAKTTICIQCSDTTRVSDIIRQKFKAQKGWGIIVHKGKVHRSGKRRNSNKRGKNTVANRAEGGKVLERSFQGQPVGGASIGAFKNCEHLPPVSFGGTILVDGEPFGMTVHHMLDAPSDDEEEEEDTDVQRSTATRESTYRTLEAQMDNLHFAQSNTDLIPMSPELELSDEEEIDDDGSDASTIRPDYAAFDAEGNEFWFLDDAPPRTPELQSDTGSDFEHLSDDEDQDDGSDSDNGSIGDRSGIDPWDDDELYVTQPAIDDVDDDFFPSDTDRDDDHLASHSFGYVYASSGIKRVVSDDVKHEIDWALIRIQKDRLKLGNKIMQDLGSRRKAKGKEAESQPKIGENPVVIDRVASSKSLSGADVYCCGRSSGFRKGRMSQAMALVKMYGRQSFSSSWCVEGGFGVPGDSGAWVYNPSTRELCGHVLAWGNKSKTAYIAPMDVLFEDIRATLGAEDVRLPVHTKESVPTTEEEDKIATEDEKVAAIKSRAMNQQIQQSRDIEVALEGIKLESEPANRKNVGQRSSAVAARQVRKDISPYPSSNRRPIGLDVAEAAS